MVRVSGRLIPSGYKTELGPDDTKSLIYSVLTDDQKAKFEEEHELDFSIGIPGLSRFRVNVFMQRGCVSGVFRTIGEKIPTCDELGLNQTIQQLALLPRGLVCVTGPTGSGKSTTLAAMINLINSERKGTSSRSKIPLSSCIRISARPSINASSARTPFPSRAH